MPGVAATFQPQPGGDFSALNISSATVVKATPGILVTISVTTSGSPGAVYDANTTGGNTAANLIGAIPANLETIYWPCFNGILIVPGAGQVVSVAYK